MNDFCIGNGEKVKIMYENYGVDTATELTTNANHGFVKYYNKYDQCV